VGDGVTRRVLTDISLDPLTGDPRKEKDRGTTIGRP
jgi:hypothetical protein